MSERPKNLESVKGSNLQLGDAIVYWWSKTARIVSLEPYRGPLAYLFKDGAQIAGFDIGPGMTIDNGDYYDRVAVPKPKTV